MLGTRKIVGRILLPVATCAAIIGVASPAFASNDWTSGSHNWKDYSFRQARSSVYGSSALLNMNWKGYKVDIWGYAKDTAKDGRSAALEIRYYVYYGGKWHKHYRYAATASGKGHIKFLDTMTARYPTKGVAARACLKNNGKVVSCDPHWH